MKKNQTFKRIVWIIAVLLLFGCAKENPDTPGRKDGKARISFSAPIIAEEVSTPVSQASGKAQPSTRAALTEKTTVRVVAFTSTNPAYSGDQAYFLDSDGKLKPCTVNADGSFKAVDMTSELALYPDKYDFYAITPALPLGANKNSVTVLNGIDYASSVTSNINVSNDQTLTLTQLDRKCAKIALVIKKGDDNTLMTALSVASGGVTINNLAPSATTASLNATINQASGTTTLDVPQSAFKTISATETSAITYLLPRLGENRIKLTYNLTYMVSGTSETKDVNGSMGNIALESGKSYTFTLTMRQAGASISVTEWIDGGSQDVVAGESFDYTDNGKGWFLIATNDAKNPDPNALDATKMNWFIASGIPDNTYNPNGKYKACPAGWKTPSLEEQLIATVYMQSLPDLIFNSDAPYWNTTVTNPQLNLAWLVTYPRMFTYDDTNSSNNRVRCIRESNSSISKYPYVIGGNVIVSRDNYGGVRSEALHRNWSDSDPMPTHGDQDVENAVAAKFEVSATIATYNVTAINASCPSGWRLPTHREMMLIWVMLKKGKLTVFSPPTTNQLCWSGTGGLPGDSRRRYLDFSNGNTGSHPENNESNKYHVRCVRDVVPSPPADPIYIGQFGGWDETAQEYTKQLQVDWGYTNTDPFLTWGPDNETTGTTNKEYGPTNITELKKKSADLSLYPAAKYCADKGNGWYLPSQNQLMAIWIAHNAVPTTFSLNLDSPYWSTTEFSSTHAWYVSVNGGGTNGFAKSKISRIRCVKDVTLQENKGPLVVTDTDNRAIIDSRGMPSEAITISKKPRDIAGGIATAETNKTVSYYFEVAKDDYSTNSSWSDAVNGCAGIADDGKGLWRLPTQRELMLIWTLHKSLNKKIAGFKALNIAFPSYYWSATENDSNSSWPIEFNSGTTSPADGAKTKTNRVRCVRDLTPPAK